MTGRRWFVLALLTVFSVIALGGTAFAENKGNAITISPMAGYVFIGDDVDADNSFGGGGGLGYNFDERWSLEYMFIWSHTDSKNHWPNGDDGLDIYINNINGVYHFQPEKKLVPYLTAGGGWGTESPDWGDNDTGFLLDWGAGIKYFVTENIALRADARHSHWWSTHTDDTVTLMAGLPFQIPIPEKECVQPCPEPVMAPPPPAPVPVVVPPPPSKCMDSDGDGVCDDKDKCPGTPAGTLVDEHGCPLKLEIHIEFDFDKTAIKPEYTSELAKAALFIKKHEEAEVILVAGHTDSIGTEAYNQGLSERRAAAVRDYLIKNFDIDGNRLVTRGYGESQPVASNETEEGRAKNRRVEIICCSMIPEK